MPPGGRPGRCRGWRRRTCFRLTASGWVRSTGHDEAAPAVIKVGRRLSARGCPVGAVALDPYWHGVTPRRTYWCGVTPHQYTVGVMPPAGGRWRRPYEPSADRLSLGPLNRPRRASSGGAQARSSASGSRLPHGCRCAKPVLARGGPVTNLLVRGHPAPIRDWRDATRPPARAMSGAAASYVPSADRLSLGPLNRP